MIDHYLTVLYQQEKTASVRSEMVEQMKKLPEAELHKIASGELKMSSLCGEDSWLDKFKGTELYEQALQLEQEKLEFDIQDQQRRLEESEVRSQENAERDQRYQVEDQIRLKKRVLELQLSQQELASLGGGQPDPMGGMEAPAPPVPPATAPPPGDPAAAMPPPAPPKPSVTQTTEEKMKVGMALALMQMSFAKEAGKNPFQDVSEEEALQLHQQLQMAAANAQARPALHRVKGALLGGATGAALGGYSGHQIAGRGGLGALIGGGIGAAGGALGASPARAQRDADEISSQMRAVGKISKTASELAKEAFMGAAMMGLKGVGQALAKNAPGMLNTAKSGLIKGVGQAANWAGKNPLAAAGIGAGALGTAALAGRASNNG